MTTTRYHVSRSIDPADTTVAWVGPRGLRAELVDDGFRVDLTRGDVSLHAGPVLDGELGIYDEDAARLDLEPADVAELGRLATRALAVRRAAVTRALGRRRRP